MKYNEIDLNKIYAEVAEELDMPFSEVRLSVTDVFRTTKQLLRDPLSHDRAGILLHGFGTFEINRGSWRHMKNKVEPFKNPKIQKEMDNRISNYFNFNNKNEQKTSE